MLAGVDCLDCFDERHSKYQELKSFLNEEEYEAARESSLTAFYTPPAVIRGIYQALEQWVLQRETFWSHAAE